MAGTQLGTEFIVGVGTTLDTYTVSSIKTGGVNVALSDVNDEDGALISRLIKQKHAKVDLELVAKTTCDAIGDWPVGAIATATGFTSYYVEDCSIDNTEDQQKVSVSLVLLGIT